MHPPSYRGCWHGVSRCLFSGYRQGSPPAKGVYKPGFFVPPRDIAPSGFRPLRKIPHCCLPEESGPCLSPNVADRSLKPATDRGLGEPSPPQLTNQTRVHPRAELLSFRPSTYEVLASVSASCPSPEGRSSRVTHPFATGVFDPRSTCMCQACRQRSS